MRLGIGPKWAMDETIRNHFAKTLNVCWAEPCWAMLSPVEVGNGGNRFNLRKVQKKKRFTCICQQHVSNISATCTRRFGKSPIQLALQIFLVIIVSWCFMWFTSEVSACVSYPEIAEFQDAFLFQCRAPWRTWRGDECSNRSCADRPKGAKRCRMAGPESQKALGADFRQAFEDAVREIDNLGEEGAKEIQKF